MEPDILDAAESQAEDDTARESSDFIYHTFEESHGYEDFPKDIQNHSQHRTKSPQNTALIQKKYQN